MLKGWINLVVYLILEWGLWRPMLAQKKWCQDRCLFKLPTNCFKLGIGIWMSGTKKKKIYGLFSLKKFGLDWMKLAYCDDCVGQWPSSMSVIRWGLQTSLTCSRSGQVMIRLRYSVSFVSFLFLMFWMRMFFRWNYKTMAFFHSCSDICSYHNVEYFVLLLVFWI